MEVRIPTGLVFQQEFLAEVMDEVDPLLQRHYKEIAHHQDIELCVDWDAYDAAEGAGFLRIYVARDEETRAILGYNVFFVRTNLHYKNSLQASQDVLFIHPDRRGFGGRFIQWCDEQLRAENVQCVYHHVKAKHNFGRLLERLGYSLVDLIYSRRLD